MFMLVIQNHPHRAGSHLRRELVRCLACHGCTSQEFEPPANPGRFNSIIMVPDLEALGIRVLLNESVAIDRDNSSIYLVGVDDAHFYRADNIEKAAAAVPHDCVSVLLSHTPEIYRQAAHAGFNLMLSGHTHGGQICLPGGIPILLEADLPRAFGAGAWHHAGMAGYTSAGTGSSVVPVRFNSRPEIALHQLRRGTPQ
jgi:predicted MPP superfamily phosphohydrolase